MRIVISAFGFAPNTGSEAGVGWQWALELSRMHDVTVVTDTARKHLIEKMSLPERLRVVFYRPTLASRIPLNGLTAQCIYIAWQFGLLSVVRGLHAATPFNLALHLTYSVFRHPCFLGELGIPFVFGPLGGGEDAPWRLKRSLTARAQVKEWLRYFFNKAARLDPLLRRSLSKSSLILVSTDETKRALPLAFQGRALTYSNLGVESVSSVSHPRRDSAEPFRLLYVGRLLGLKGVHLALRSVRQLLDSGVKSELTIIGDGPYESALRKLCQQLGLSRHVKWMGRVSRSSVFAHYSDAHAFIFPSLHDSGGTVVLEAQSLGLPVICFDLGGPPTLVGNNSGIVVRARDCENEHEVVLRLSDAVQYLAAHEDVRLEMASAAVEHAAKFLWPVRVNGAMEIIEKHLSAEGAD